MFFVPHQSLCASNTWRILTVAVWGPNEYLQMEEDLNLGSSSVFPLAFQMPVRLRLHWNCICLVFGPYVLCEMDQNPVIGSIFRSILKAVEIVSSCSLWKKSVLFPHLKSLFGIFSSYCPWLFLFSICQLFSFLVPVHNLCSGPAVFWHPLHDTKK